MPTVWLSDAIMEQIEQHKQGDEPPTRTLERMLDEPKESSGDGLTKQDVEDAVESAITDAEPIEAVSGRSY